MTGWSDADPDGSVVRNGPARPRRPQETGSNPGEHDFHNCAECRRLARLPVKIKSDEITSVIKQEIEQFATELSISEVGQVVGTR